MRATEARHTTEREGRRRRSGYRWVLACLALLSFGLVGGCVRGVKMPTFPNQIKLAPLPGAKAGAKVLFYGADHKIVPYVIHALQKALRTSEMWGGLASPVAVRIFPTHRSLEEAVLRRYEWLRAWALFHEVYLQSPRTWKARFFHSALTELLVHELTHVVMYQQCCSRESWRNKDIPFWFREGMASFTAKQGRRSWSMERLALFVRSPKGQQVLKHPERHLTRHQPVAYSLAHWKFVLLIKGWKVKGVRRLLALMRKGKSFANAFADVCQISLREFGQRFEKKLQEASMVGRKSKHSRVRVVRLPQESFRHHLGCGHAFSIRREHRSPLHEMAGLATSKQLLRSRRHDISWPPASHNSPKTQQERGAR